MAGPGLCSKSAATIPDFIAASIAIDFAGAVRAQVIVSNPASRGEKLARRTGVNVARLVIGEILAREDAIFALLQRLIAKSIKWHYII